MFQQQKGEIERSTNGVVKYSLVGGGGNFTIDPNSGMITVKSKLDREEKPEWNVSSSLQYTLMQK